MTPSVEPEKMKKPHWNEKSPLNTVLRYRVHCHTVIPVVAEIRMNWDGCAFRKVVMRGFINSE